MKFKEIYLFTLSFVILIFTPIEILAVPHLGVATDGIYYVAPGDSFEDYQDYFASGWAPASENGGNEGFALGPSGSDLTIFTDIMNHDIYLLTDSAAGSSNSPIYFGGKMLTKIPYPTGQADGYKPTPYYALNIGEVDTNNGWVAIGNDPNAPASLSSFYAYTKAIEYIGTISPGSYFFAAADMNDDGMLHFNHSNHDRFSPKTTSTTAPIPEPATLLLLGGGIIGIRIFRRWYR